jgi:hypothetical protein
MAFKDFCAYTDTRIAAVVAGDYQLPVVHPQVSLSMPRILIADDHDGTRGILKVLLQ